MKTEYEPFDVAADYLVSEERVAGYLSAAAEDEDPNVLLLALCDAAKARGMMEVAKAAGLNRESLYKALKPGAHPRFETVQAVLRALGVKLAMTPGSSPGATLVSTEPETARVTPPSEDDLRIAARRIGGRFHTTVEHGFLGEVVGPKGRGSRRPSVKAMNLPDVTEKIMNRSYQRSGVVAGGTLLSSGARQAPRPLGEGIVKASAPDSIAAEPEKKRGRRYVERRGNPPEK